MVITLQKELTMVKQVKYQGGLVQSNEWDSYVEDLGNDTFVGYFEANEHVVKALEPMIKKARDFEELKSELLEFVKQRKSFIRYAGKNFP